MHLQVFRTRTPKLVHPDSGLGRRSGARCRADETQATRSALHPTTTTNIGGEDVIAGYGQHPFGGGGVRGMVVRRSATQPFAYSHASHDHRSGGERPGVGHLQQSGLGPQMVGHVSEQIALPDQKRDGVAISEIAQ